MGLLPVGLGAVAAYLSYYQGATITAWIAALAAVGGCWSFGVMHNYAVAAATKRRSHRGGFSDFLPSEAEKAPNSWTAVNMLSAVVSAIALGIAIFRAL